MGRKVRKSAPLGIVLDAASPDPLHRQIGAQLRAAILERRLRPGTKLPSSRLMAAELRCARGTVSSAIDQLIAEGYVASRAASGIEVAPDLPDAPPRVVARSAPPELPARTSAVLTAEPDQAGHLAFPLGQPDRHAFPFPLWAKLLEQEWRRPAWEIAGTPHPFGHPELQRAIAAYLGAARGFACEPDAIVITSGIRQSVGLFARVVLEEGEAAFIEDPGYPGMAEGLAAAAIHPIPVAIDAAGFPIETATALSPQTKLAIVAPSHQFPLGTVLTLQRRLELLSWAERTRGWIVEDDFDGEYRYAGRPLAPLRALDRSNRVAYLGSFSKILFPALRLSYLVLPAGLLDATRRIMAGMGPGASLLGQGALARFIGEGHFAVHLRRTRLLYAARQEALIAAARHLSGLLRLAPDPGGMQLIATPEPGTPFDDQRATARALAHDVRVAPLSAYYRSGQAAQGLILGYAGTPEPEIEPALIRLRTALSARNVA
jgi:GntR family transcriptional regulator/MocR family aminotransferase